MAKMTKVLEAKIRAAVKAAGNDRYDIDIHHRGKDYVCVFIQNDDMGWTDDVRVYEHCETDIRETYICTVQSKGGVVVEDIRYN